MRSPGWRKVKKRFLEKNPECAVCGTKKKLEIHHVIPVHADKSLELEIKNLITLCDPHHFLYGHFLSWHSWNSEVRKDADIWNKKIKNR